MTRAFLPALLVVGAITSMPATAFGDIFGHIDGYVTLSPATTTVQSTINATYFPDVIICTGAVSNCRYALQGDHRIMWSRSGDVVASRGFSVQNQTYRASLSASTAAGECYFATGSAVYLFLEGTVMPGISIPFTPYELATKSAWQSSTVCRPAAPIELSQLCPLVLDLTGNGIATSGLGDAVSFWDLDHDGVPDPSGWLARGTDDAFLWIDLDDDHNAQQDELFGSAMAKADGTYFANGFQALAQYDTAAFGGNGDGAIDESDGVWNELRLWIDVNHDGVSQPAEISPPARERVVRLELDRVHDHAVDPQGNSLMLVGSYARRGDGNDTVSHLLADIAFAR